jgi:hypothetical protein
MVATGRKCKNEIFYRASDGITKSIDRKWLLYEYDIRFAEGSGTAIGRAMQEEKVLTLQGAGLMDPQSALERMGIKGVGQIVERFHDALERLGWLQTTDIEIAGVAHAGSLTDTIGASSVSRSPASTRSSIG